MSSIKSSDIAHGHPQEYKYSLLYEPLNNSNEDTQFMPIDHRKLYYESRSTNRTESFT